MPPVFPLLSLVCQSLAYIVFFVVLISFFGLTTGIRRAYVWVLLWLFEHVAKLERGSVAEGAELPTPAAAEGHEEEDKGTSASTPAREEEEPSHKEKAVIIRPRWSTSIDSKLAVAMDQQHTDNHPLAQRMARVASQGRGLQKLAETDDPMVDDDDDAEYTTMKVLVGDTLEFLSAGIEAIIEDEVTHRFEAAQLPCWNFLARNRAQQGFLRMNWLSLFIWALGVLVRYGLLFPVRLLLFCLSGTLLLGTTALIGCLPCESLRSLLYRPLMLMCMRIAARIFSTVVTFHDTRNRPEHGICVANHTSPIDVMVLSTDNCYAMVGQRQGGILGATQRALSQAAHHIWFERGESGDRAQVVKRLKEHVEHPAKMPILIFPEGTCINNTSVMLFKKGSFEVSPEVHPIAMKYDSRLGDPFWNSHRQGYLAHMLSMMTAWALICEVWYLPPMRRREGESSIEFARRCQRAIARRGGMVDLGWDGNLKRTRVPERLRNEQKELFYQYLARTTPICACGQMDREQMETVHREIHPEVFRQEGEAEEEETTLKEH